METTLPAMSGERAFLELLKQEGVEIMFGNPGTTELPLMDAFAVENEIKYVLGLQEAALMSMSDGYAQASGKLAVLNFHVAPGLGNAMGMLYDAQKAASPVLITAGQQDTEYLATEPILSADLPTLARPFVKWAAEVQRLPDLPRMVHRAAKTALAPPTGPVFLALPGDILKAEVEIDLMGPTRVGPRLRGDAAEIAKAAAILAEAKRPVIMAGDAVAQSHALAELVELAELIGAPVYAEFVPNTASFPASHPLFRGNVTRLQTAVRKILDEYDVLVSAGGEARARLQTTSEASLADREALKAKARALTKTTPVQPLALLHAVGDMLPNDAVVIEEALSSAPGIRQLIRSDDPQSYFGLRGGGIGWGLPAAIGVKLALPHRPVVALIGDGSAMYTIQALWTAAHYRIGVVFVILNNTSYRILKQRLLALRGHAEQADTFVGMELLDPAVDFLNLARSFGVAAERAKTVAEATDLIAKGLASNTSLLIDVTLDRAFKPM